MLNNLRILFILIVIGLLTHFQTLKFGLFGDDWQAIYWYLSQETVGGYFNNLPGLLKYLTQYGGQLLLTGIAYDLFGSNYSYYYITSLLFKITASFSLYLLIKKLTVVEPEHNIAFIPLISAILFLAGITGIQTTDFVVQMGVFLAAALSFLSIYLLYQSIELKSMQNGLISLILGTLAIVIAPIRLFPFILIFPASILFIYQIYGSRKNLWLIFILFLTWIFIVSSLWYIGVFSAPGQISLSYISALKQFVSVLTSNPLILVLTFFQWLGVVIIPDQFIANKNLQTTIGSLFVFLSISAFFLLRKEREGFFKLTISAIPLIFFLMLMFIYSSGRMMSSEDRYLVMIFYGFCLFFAVAIIISSRSKSKLLKQISTFLVIFLVSLIFIHVTQLQVLYGSWLNNGRGSAFIRNTEKIFTNSFPTQLNDNKIIYLDFDNTKTLYFIQYGLDFKLLVLTNTFQQKYFPAVIIDRMQIIERMQKISPSEHQNIISNIHSYSLKNGLFWDSTDNFRKDLQIELKLTSKDI